MDQITFFTSDHYFLFYDPNDDGYRSPKKTTKW